ncbi:MAG: hypothetical protein OEO82_04045 [Gammaproteobacteria bacterium]|nr:hypothetical protein [Gammaproteobacteria bacterium]
MASRNKSRGAELPTFPAETAAIRDGDWAVATAAQIDPASAKRLSGLQGYRQARQWSDAQEATSVIVVVDTVNAALELDEILYELRKLPVAIELNPFGYLFSFIKTFSERPECVLPDRADMTWSTHCLRSYARHAIDTAQRRGAVVIDAGQYDVAAPFAGDEQIEAADLLQVPRGRITEDGVRDNLRIVLQHVASVLLGKAVHDLEAAGSNAMLAELARAQLWQWEHHETGVLDEGRIITGELLDEWLGEELQQLGASVTADEGASAALEQAAELLRDLTHAHTIAPFLLDEAYRRRE